MESIREMLNYWLEGFQNYINSFTVVEKQNKIFYFSKYSLILSEFYQIYTFVKTLKEKIFSSFVEQFKYCVKDLIIFNNQNLSIKEKVIILFSSCLLIYYKKFCFDTNNTFEQYFDNDFIYISSTTFGYQIVNQELFKIFIFYYYSQLKKEIISLDYNSIKNLKKYYSYKEYKNNNNNNNINNDNELSLGKNNCSRVSTNNSLDNDYFPDPNVLLPKKNISQNKEYNEMLRNKINDQANNNNMINIKENDEDNDNIFNTNPQQENYGFQEQVLTYLTSTKERIFDLVFEMGYKGYFPIFNKDINDRLQQFNDIIKNNLHLENNRRDDSSDVNDLPQIPKTFNVNKNSINSINKNTNINKINSINDVNQKLKSNINSILNSGIFNNNIDKEQTNLSNNLKEHDNNNSFFLNDICCNFQSLYNYYANSSKDDDISNNNNRINYNNNNNNIINNNNSNNSNKYTKRIISELSKYEVEDNIVQIIEEVAKKIDSNYLDKVLNNSQKNVTVINYFSCYVVEFGPEILQNIEPKYKDVLKNFCIKFIVLAKELYNTTMELFTTIYDLSYTNMHTFIDLSKNCGIQIQYAESLYNMFKDYSELLLKQKESNSNIKNILKKLFKQQKILWDKTIKQKANEFTTFYKVQNL